MSKNNPKNRGAQVVKKFNGKVVKPVLYIGTHAGHGRYMAVLFEDGKMALDVNGKPVLWSAI